MSTKNPTRRELTQKIRKLERDRVRSHEAQRATEAQYIKLYAKFKEGNILQSTTKTNYFCCVVHVQAYRHNSKAQSLEMIYTYRKCDSNGHGMRSYLANQRSSEVQLMKHGYKKVLDGRAAFPASKGKAAA